jgi:hypothetical protein
MSGSKNPIGGSELTIYNPKQRVTVTLTSAEQNVRMTDAIAFSKLHITNYAIKGAPSTVGVPDSSAYYIRLDASGIAQNHWLNTSGAQGIPLFLDGAFTSRIVEPAIPLVDSPHPLFLREFRVVVRDSTGATPAVFTEMLLTLEAD